MKYFFKWHLFVLLLIAINSYSQESGTLIDSIWKDLKLELDMRSDTIVELTKVISKSHKVNLENLQKSLELAKSLQEYLQGIDCIDSISISNVNNLNNRLRQALSRTLVSLENDPAFRNQNNVLSMYDQLFTCEKRISLIKQKYNDLCSKVDRKDLLFDPSGIGKKTHVAF